MPIPPWKIWTKHPEVEGTLVKRATGELPEMESTKQLVKLMGTMYHPNMRVLDVGCNTGHYLRGLRRIDESLSYTGVDAHQAYISQAKKIFAADSHAKFFIKDIFKPLFPRDKYDIVFCCNVLLHLPDFRQPIKNLLVSTKKVCFIRTLLGDYTTIVYRAIKPNLQSNGLPKTFVYQNTWETNTVTSYIRKLGWKATIIKDEFNPRVLAAEYTKLKKGQGTTVIDDHQVDGSIIFNWQWLKITR